MHWYQFDVSVIDLEPFEGNAALIDLESCFQMLRNGERSVHERLVAVWCNTENIAL